MFNTKGQNVKSDLVKKSLGMGVEKAKIFSYSIKESKTNKKQLVFVLEGPAIEGFEGWEIDKDFPEKGKFKGKSAKVNVTRWLDTDTFNNPNVSENEILSKITAIAQTLGVKDKLDEIDASTIELWVEKSIELINKDYMFWFLTGEENEFNGKTFVKLSLPKYNFVSLDSSTFEEFNKNNKYHFKRLEKKETNDFDTIDVDF